MAKHRETVDVPEAEAVDFLQKAAEFQDSAEAALKAGKRNAAGVLAIHAPITAVDSITIFYLGVRSAGQRHQDAVGLLGLTARPRQDSIQPQLSKFSPRT